MEIISVRIQWNRGMFTKELNLKTKIRTVLSEIGKIIGIEQNYLDLCKDQFLKDVIPKKLSVEEAGIKNKTFLYLKILNFKNLSYVQTDICKMTYPIDTYKKYLGNDEREMTEEMKRVQHDFGPKAISTSFFEHRMSLKPQIDYQYESSCYAFRIGKECMKRFQSIAFQTGFASHRISFLFGRTNRITGKVTVHASSEPIQINEADKVKIDPNFNFITMINIANKFGMECVGMAISHKSKKHYPMVNYMVLMAAKYQSLFNEYFTTVVVTPKNEDDITMEAFQISDAGVKIYCENFYSEQDEPHKIKFKEKLIVCGQKKNEADVNLFLCAVRVRLTSSKFPNHSFPSPSQNPSKIDLKMHFENNEYTPSWFQFFDFNLLVFFENYKVFGDETENIVNTIISNIISKNDISETILEKLHKWINI